MLSLPKDVIRLLCEYLPPRQRVVFTQTCTIVRSCTTLRDRLTWGVGPPENKIGRQLTALAKLVAPDFEFEISNFCFACEATDHTIDNCRYTDTQTCDWCSNYAVPIWPYMPWYTIGDNNKKQSYYKHFGITCYNCKEPVPWDAVSTDVCGCLQCMAFFCDRCSFDTCRFCNERVLSREGVPDDHQCPRTDGKWHKLIHLHSASLGLHTQVREHKRYIPVFDETEGRGAMVQLWVLDDAEPREVGKHMGHSPTHRRSKYDDAMPFLCYVGPWPPRPDTPLMDQVKRVLTLGEYVTSLEGPEEKK